LAIGTAMSAELKPEDIGRPAMVEKVAAAVKAAMRDAGIDDPNDVHYVQTKTPLLTIESVREAERRGKDVACEVHESMGISNGTTALGIGVALGEIKMPRAEQICRDLDLYSSVASCSSGVELTQAQIVLLGNKAGTAAAIASAAVCVRSTSTASTTRSAMPAWSSRPPRAEDSKGGWLTF
jgi:cyanuric acid amidohydrolase